MRGVIRRAAVAAGAAVVLLGAAVWAAGPAAAIPGPVVLYAYAGGKAASTVTSCPQDTTGTAANECSLAEALSLAGPGSTIDLATPGGTAHYVGNWTVRTNFTVDTAPVTIEPAPGLASQPVLDGGGSSGPGGPVLTVQAGQFVALSGITITNGNNTNTSGGGGLANAGTVTITGSTFAGNTTVNDGGAIDNADGTDASGTVTVTASTFTGNTAFLGGAIASGEWGGFGTVTVTASTFTGNTVKVGGPNGLGGYGGAISIGYGGGGTATVTASTFSGNTAEAAGGAIASGGNGGGGTMTVAGDLFDGSCAQAGGTWTDGGYNAGTDTTCFASPTPATGDKSDSTVGSDLQTAPTGNGGPTQTIAPTTGNKAIGLIPDPTTVTLGSGQVALCPATDQRGYPSAASTACDAGAVQTSGWPPQVTGTHQPPAHGPEGYRLGATGNTWKLYVTHPGTTKVSFTGKVSVPAGTLGNITLINPTTGHKVTSTGTAITFTLPDSGTVTGFSFTTSTTVASITFTLNIAGHPATTSQIYLGGKATHPATGSPLTFTR